MREPPLGLDVVPDENLEIFFDEILAAPTTDELLLGIYERAIPALIAALERHRSRNESAGGCALVAAVKFALIELDEMRDYGQRSLAALRSTLNVESRTLNVKPAAGAVETEGASRRSTATFNVQRSTFNARSESAARRRHRSLNSPPQQRYYSATPFVYDGIPKRDERFPDPYNMGVNAEVFLYDPTMPPEPKMLMMFYKRLREIDVPEMMASIITETPDKPWGYYRDMTRQLWDEARHAMMGEVGFVNLGVDWRKVMVNFTWSLALEHAAQPRRSATACSISSSKG